MSLNGQPDLSRNPKKPSRLKGIWFGPALLAGIVILVVGGLLWSVYNHNFNLQQQKLREDTLQAARDFTFHLDNDREYLLLLAEEKARGVLDEKSFRERASHFVTDHPGLINITWADENFIICWTAPYEPNKQVIGLKLTLPEPERASRKAYETKQPVYTRPFEVIQGAPAFEVYVPVFQGDRFLGTFGGVYSIENILRRCIPQNLYENYHIAFLDQSGNVIRDLPASASIDRQLIHREPLDIPGNNVSIMLSRYEWETWPRWVWVLIILCIGLAVGMAWGMIVLRRDIRTRVQYETAVKEANSFLNDVIDSLTHPFYVIDVQTFAVELANRAVSDEKTPTNITCHALTHGRDTPCDSPDHDCPVKVIKATKKPFTTEHVHLDKDGNNVYSEVHGYPIFDAHGNVEKVIEYSLDISDRKRVEEQSRRLADQLRDAQKMEAIGTLAGGIAHEFNNVLGAITGFTELAADDTPENTPARTNLQQVLVAANRAKEMVRKILDFSRKEEAERKPVLLKDIIGDTIKTLRSTLPGHTEIRTSLEKNLTFVPANPSEIRQVISHLCTNAAHAMADNGGAIEITLDEIEVEPGSLKGKDLLPGKYQQLTVTDTGTGMPLEIKDRVFEPYFTTKEQGVGTGMGLAVVHGIVKRHGGQVTFTSQQGKGTTFHVLLPNPEVKPT
ncbi:MAG: PAS domain-containing protein [bacterium]|nr:PAS domain-containing protein [bacterium]